MCGDSYDQFVEETSKLSGGESDGGGGGVHSSNRSGFT